MQLVDDRFLPSPAASAVVEPDMRHEVEHHAEVKIELDSEVVAMGLVGEAGTNSSLTAYAAIRKNSGARSQYRDLRSACAWAPKGHAGVRVWYWHGVSIK